jgi:hypothetical protein
MYIMDYGQANLFKSSWVDQSTDYGLGQFVLKEKKSRGKKGRCYLQVYNATNQAARIKV